MEEIQQPDISAIVPMEIDSKRKRRRKESKRNFGLFIIFEKTFLELLSLRRVLSYLGLSIIFPFILTMIVSEQMTGTLADMSIDFQIATVVNYFAFSSFFWNAGIFVWKVHTIVDGIRRHMPRLYASLLKIEEGRGISGIYKNLKKISIDYGIMEKAKNRAFFRKNRLI